MFDRQVPKRTLTSPNVASYESSILTPEILAREIFYFKIYAICHFAYIVLLRTYSTVMRGLEIYVAIDQHFSTIDKCHLANRQKCAVC